MKYWGKYFQNQKIVKIKIYKHVFMRTKNNWKKYFKIKKTKNMQLLIPTGYFESRLRIIYKTEEIIIFNENNIFQKIKEIIL